MKYISNAVFCMPYANFLLVDGSLSSLPFPHLPLTSPHYLGFMGVSPESVQF